MLIIGSNPTVALTSLDPKSQDRDPNGYSEHLPP